jgi:hypothetical protein
MLPVYGQRAPQRGRVIVPCMRCDQPFDRRRSSGRFCPNCRPAINTERQVARDRRRRLARDELRTVLDGYVLGGMDRGTNDDAIDAYVSRGEALDLVDCIIRDRMPTGAFTPAGSDDGCSTNDEEFRDCLDEHAAVVAAHRWWIDNPHVFASLEHSEDGLRDAA